MGHGHGAPSLTLTLTQSHALRWTRSLSSLWTVDSSASSGTSGPALKRGRSGVGPSSEQCGRRVPKSEYTGRGWFKGCNTKADHGADLNMSRLLAAAGAAHAV